MKIWSEFVSLHVILKFVDTNRINKIFKNIELQYSKKNNRLMEEQSYEEIHSPSNVDTGNYD